MQGLATWRGFSSQKESTKALEASFVGESESLTLYTEADEPDESISLAGSLEGGGSAAEVIDAITSLVELIPKHLGKHPFFAHIYGVLPSFNFPALLSDRTFSLSSEDKVEIELLLQRDPGILDSVRPVYKALYNIFINSYVRRTSNYAFMFTKIAQEFYKLDSGEVRKLDLETNVPETALSIPAFYQAVERLVQQFTRISCDFFVRMLLASRYVERASTPRQRALRFISAFMSETILTSLAQQLEIFTKVPKYIIRIKVNFSERPMGFMAYQKNPSPGPVYPGPVIFNGIIRWLCMLLQRKHGSNWQLSKSDVGYPEIFSPQALRLIPLVVRLENMSNRELILWNRLSKK